MDLRRFLHYWDLFLKSWFKRLGIILIVSLILFLGWNGFLFLVGKPPIPDIWPALVMVWLSMIILLLAVFPQLFEKIKKIRIKDFELILKKLIDDSTQKNVLSLSDFDLEKVRFEKGNYENLKNLIKKSILEPDRSLVLVVNIRQEKDNISLPLLFTHLFLLNFVSPSIIVLFISSDTSTEYKEITPDNTLGVITVQDMLHKFYKLFPELLNLFNLFEKSGEINEVFNSGNFKDFSFEKFSQKANDIFQENDDYGNTRYLTSSDIRNWFGEKLSTRLINLPLNNKSYRKIYKALEEDDKYIILSKNSRIKSIISVTNISNNITTMVMEDLITK